MRPSKNTLIDGDRLVVDTATTGTIRSLGVAGAGAGNVAVAGNITLNLTAQDARSKIAGSIVNVTGAGGDVTVTSTNSATIGSISGGAAFATDFLDSKAIGAAIAFTSSLTRRTLRLSIART